MGLITLFLTFFLPRYTDLGKIQNTARKLLTLGTSLVTVHFILQNILHKNIDNVSEIRTVVNLLFGIPISYTFNLSYLYLQRLGSISKFEWLFGPIAFSLSLLVAAAYYIVGFQGLDSNTTAYTMSVIYASVLFLYCILQVREYFRIVRNIRNNGVQKFIPLLRWTRWSMFAVVIIGLGFPVMTFNPNLLMRSLYGILSISSAFFYILCFIGYSFNYKVKSSLGGTSKIEPVCKEEEGDRKEQVKEMQLARIGAIVDKYVEKGCYLQSGITIKDVAVEMGISCNMLKMWLKTTPYKKFSNWLVYLRIEKAKDLLLAYPDLNCEEIAEKCGFCDRQYFQHQFTKQVGISPSKWIIEHDLSEFIAANSPSE